MTTDRRPVVCQCDACGIKFNRTRTRANRPDHHQFCSTRCYWSNKPRRPAETRFWAKVSKTSTCWVWTGATQIALPYGNFWNGTKLVRAHRFSWELHVGPIPDGMWVLHHCDNPPCVRPDHLFLGDALDNVRNMIAKDRQGIPAHPAARRPHPWAEHPELRLRGEQSSQSKLTDGLVRYIRDQVAAGTLQKDLAIELGVAKMTISRVVRGKNWSHITQDEGH